MTTHASRFDSHLAWRMDRAGYELPQYRAHEDLAPPPRMPALQNVRLRITRAICIRGVRVEPGAVVELDPMTAGDLVSRQRAVLA